MCQQGSVRTLTNNIFTNDQSTVDECIFEFIEGLNDRGIATVACCCGHGELQIMPYVTLMCDLDEIQGVLDDVEKLGWKNLWGFLQDPHESFAKKISPSFDFQNKVFLGIYAYGGLEQLYAESQQFMAKLR